MSTLTDLIKRFEIMSYSYKFIKNDFICPLTGKIFYEPVMASDGFMYENDAIRKWLKNNNTSPKTGIILNHKNISHDFIFNKVFNNFLKLNKDIQRYKPEINFIECIKNKDYNKIINSNILNITFDIQNLGNFDFFKNNDLVKFFIKNNIILMNKKGMRLIHLICRYSTSEMIKYIIDIYLKEGHDIQCETRDKWKPIHFICRYSTPEMIKYIINIYIQKGYNIQCQTKEKYKPIHFICRYSTPEMIKYIIDIYIKKRYNLYCETIDGWQLIHLICKYSTPEMIKYIINIYQKKGYNINCKIDNEFEIIHIICKYSTPEMIKYIIDIYFEKGYNITYTVINIINKRSLPYLVKYIQNKRNFIQSIYQTINYIFNKKN